MYNEKLKNAVIQYTGGDPNAFSDIYNLTKDGFYHLAYSITQNAELTEDVLQDAYLKISTSVFQLEAPEAFLNWSRTMIRRMAWEKCKRKDEQEILLDTDNEYIFEEIEEERSDFIPDADFDRKELCAIVQSILEELPEAQRIALLYFYREEDKITDIAKSMNCPVGTIKSRLNKGRVTLLDKVKAYEEQHDIRLHAALPVPFILSLLKDIEAPYPSVPNALNFINDIIVQSARSTAKNIATGSVEPENQMQIAKKNTETVKAVRKQSMGSAAAKSGATTTFKGIASLGAMKIVSIILAFSVAIGGGVYGVHRTVNNEPTTSEKEQILDAYSEYFADYNGINELTGYSEPDESFSGGNSLFYGTTVIKQNSVPNFIMAYAFPNADIKVWSYIEGSIFDLDLNLDYFGFDETVIEYMTSEKQDELLIIKYSIPSDSEIVESIENACIWKVIKSDEGLKIAGKYIFNGYNKNEKRTYEEFLEDDVFSEHTTYEKNAESYVLPNAEMFFDWLSSQGIIAEHRGSSIDWKNAYEEFLSEYVDKLNYLPGGVGALVKDVNRDGIPEIIFHSYCNVNAITFANGRVTTMKPIGDTYFYKNKETYLGNSSRYSNIWIDEDKMEIGSVTSYGGIGTDLNLQMCRIGKRGFETSEMVHGNPQQSYEKDFSPNYPITSMFVNWRITNNQEGVNAFNMYPYNNFEQKDYEKFSDPEDLKTYLSDKLGIQL